MSKDFDVENQEKIYLLIQKNPGLNLSEISKILNLKVQLVDYHTRYLVSKKLIIYDKEKGFKRYYVAGKTGIKEKRFFGVLRQEIPLKITLFLLEYPYSQHKEILSNFNISASTLTYHINKLVKNGIICLQETDEKKGYVIVNEKEVIDFLRRYKPSEILKRFKDTWDNFHIP